MPPPKGYPPVPQTMGEHIKRKRMDEGQQQQELAKMLGVHAASVRNWEKGRSAIQLDLVPRVLDFLGYDPRPCPRSRGGRLMWLREREGMSQQELARRIGVDPSSLAQAEDGLRLRPDIDWRIEAVLEFAARGAKLSDFALEREHVWNGYPAEVASLGDRLRKRRLDLGISVAEAAEHLGCCVQTVFNWELRGKGISRMREKVVSFVD